MGSGRFVAPKTLEVWLNDGGTRVLAGDQVFLNIGTHAAIPSVPGLGAARPLTHIEALELDYAPSHLVVLGGGYVGLELAQAYLKFLYTPEAQNIIGKNFYRPRDEKVAAKFGDKFPRLKLVTIDDTFGGWKNAQKTHFDDGGVFDQVYQPSK